MGVENNYELIVIGGGPAGLAAAEAARKNGVSRLLILERDKELGGILNQCIHNGFGLHTFQEELTGPEYAQRFIDRVEALGIEYKLNTMVLDISPEKKVTAMNREEGLFELQADAVILAMGCRERPRGALNIPGYRPAGIYSAGTAQRLVNTEGRMPGREVVILGSGDIGLIMARRMTLEGAKVKLVAELMPYSGGLKRNIVQCLDDFGIPLRLSTTVVDIDGKDRVKGVTLAKVDGKGKPVAGTEEYYSCDTLLLSVGLLPENELSKGAGVELSPATNGPIVNESLETSVPGIFACGNVLHVHDLVDFVSEEAASAGEHAAKYLKAKTAGTDGEKAEKETTEKNMAAAGVGLPGTGKEMGEETEHAEGGRFNEAEDKEVRISPENGVRYTVPSIIRVKETGDSLKVRFRVGAVYIGCYISVYLDEERIIHRKRQVMAPGEMEEILLKKEVLLAHSGLEHITVKIEEA